jgi:hypothetical protein
MALIFNMDHHWHGAIRQKATDMRNVTVAATHDPELGYRGLAPDGG